MYLYKDSLTLNEGTYHIAFETVDECPICHKSITPNYLYSHAEETKYVAVFNQCPGCKRTFISRYMQTIQTMKNRSIDYHVLNYVRSLPVEYKKHDFGAAIDKLCPSFSEIYNQSAHAEQLGLTHICGMGYRKAIEYLLKAYCQTLFPDMDVSKMHLSDVIKKIDDGKISALAFAAKEIGNGEAHISRTDYSLEDMKNFINAIVYFVNYHLAVLEAQQAFPNRR